MSGTGIGEDDVEGENESDTERRGGKQNLEEDPLRRGTLSHGAALPRG